VGTLDDLQADFGDRAFEPVGGPRPKHRWYELCTCGHLGKHHSPTVGGSYRIKEPYPKHMGGGKTATITTVFDGCVGAARTPRTDAIVTESIDREAGTMVERIITTCPCVKFQPIVSVDRPNQFFCQRIPRGGDREDPLRHPFVIGIRAFRTYLSKRKDAIADPDWVTAEFDRRFTWLDGARRCGLSKCTTTDGVWPVYVDGDRSELRCAQHR